MLKQLLLLTCILTGFSSMAQQSDVQRSWLVQFRSAADARSAMETERENRSMQDLHWKTLSYRLSMYEVTWDPATTGAATVKAYLETLGNLVALQADREVHLRDLRPNDSDYSLQYYLDLIGAPAAWAQGTGGVTALGDTIVAAVLERGAGDPLHEDLQSLFWYNRAEIPGDGIDNDGNGFIDDYAGINILTGNDQHLGDIENHATPVCGIIGANGNNGLGVAGLNWQSKILMISGVRQISHIIQAYDYVIDMRRRYEESGGREGAFIVVTNASFGIDGAFPDEEPMWCAMYDALGEAGILSATATANAPVDVDRDGDLPTTCPSDYLIGVTNTNRQDRRTPNAAYGKTSIDLGAPGANIYTTFSDQRYGAFDGTSAATPVVAGAIALLYSMPSEKLAEAWRDDAAALALEIKQILIQTVRPIDDLRDRTVSGGRLNLQGAMLELAHRYGNWAPEYGLANLHPNPAHDVLYYSLQTPQAGNHEVLVVNLLGQIVYQETRDTSLFDNTRLYIDTGRLAPGQYLLSIRDQKKIVTRPFIKML